MPPQSVEAEQAVLGGLMLVRPEKLDAPLACGGTCSVSASTAGTTSSWRDPPPAREAPAGRRGDARRVVRVARPVRARGQRRVPVELAKEVPPAANVRAYAEIVARWRGAEPDRDRHRDRERWLPARGATGAGDRRSGADAPRLRCWRTNRASSSEMAPVLQSVFDDPTEARTPPGLTIDRFHRLRCADQRPGARTAYILAARPKMGKTTLAQNIAEHFALVHKERRSRCSARRCRPRRWAGACCPRWATSTPTASVAASSTMPTGERHAAMRKLRAAPLPRRPGLRNARVEHIVAQIRRRIRRHWPGGDRLPA